MRIISLALLTLCLLGCSGVEPLPGTLLLTTDTHVIRIHKGKTDHLERPHLWDLKPSPDGRFILGQNRDLWAYFHVGSTTLHPISQELWPVLEWSPQADRIAIGEPGTLRILAVPSNRETTFEVAGSSVRHIVWAPNGERLAVTVRSDEEYDKVYVVDMKAGTLTKVHEGKWALARSWSPDSQQLVLGHHTETGYPLYLYHVATGATSSLIDSDRLLASLPKRDADELSGVFFSPGWVEWTPDGAWLVYNAKAVPFGRFFVGAVKADGSQLHTWLLPSEGLDIPSPGYRCHATHTYHWATTGLLVRLAGDGCIYRLVLLDWPSLTVQQEWELPNPAHPETLVFSPDDALALSVGYHTGWIALKESARVPNIEVSGKPLGWFPDKHR